MERVREACVDRATMAEYAREELEDVAKLYYNGRVEDALRHLHDAEVFARVAATFGSTVGEKMVEDIKVVRRMIEAREKKNKVWDEVGNIRHRAWSGLLDDYCECLEQMARRSRRG